MEAEEVEAGWVEVEGVEVEGVEVEGVEVEGGPPLVNCYLLLVWNLEGDLDDCLWLASWGGGRGKLQTPDGRLGDGGQGGGGAWE